MLDHILGRGKMQTYTVYGPNDWHDANLQKLRAWLEHFTNASDRVPVSTEVYKTFSEWCHHPKALEVICKVLATRLQNPHGAEYPTERQKAIDFVRFLPLPALITLSDPLGTAMDAFSHSGAQPDPTYHAIASDLKTRSDTHQYEALYSHALYGWDYGWSVSQIPASWTGHWVYHPRMGYCWVV